MIAHLLPLQTHREASPSSSLHQAVGSAVTPASELEPTPCVSRGHGRGPRAGWCPPQAHCKGSKEGGEPTGPRGKGRAHPTLCEALA